MSLLAKGVLIVFIWVAALIEPTPIGEVGAFAASVAILGADGDPEQAAAESLSGGAA